MQEANTLTNFSEKQLEEIRALAENYLNPQRFDLIKSKSPTALKTIEQLNVDLKVRNADFFLVCVQFYVWAGYEFRDLDKYGMLQLANQLMEKCTQFSVENYLSKVSNVELVQKLRSNLRSVQKYPHLVAATLLAWVNEANAAGIDTVEISRVAIWVIKLEIDVYLKRNADALKGTPDLHDATKALSAALGSEDAPMSPVLLAAKLYAWEVLTKKTLSAKISPTSSPKKLLGFLKKEPVLEEPENISDLQLKLLKSFRDFESMKIFVLKALEEVEFDDDQAKRAVQEKLSRCTNATVLLETAKRILNSLLSEELAESAIQAITEILVRELEKEEKAELARKIAEKEAAVAEARAKEIEVLSDLHESDQEDDYFNALVEATEKEIEKAAREERKRAEEKAARDKEVSAISDLHESDEEDDYFNALLEATEKEIEEAAREEERKRAEEKAARDKEASAISDLHKSDDESEYLNALVNETEQAQRNAEEEEVKKLAEEAARRQQEELESNESNDDVESVPSSGSLSLDSPQPGSPKTVSPQLESPKLAHSINFFAYVAKAKKDFAEIVAEAEKAKKYLTAEERIREKRRQLLVAHVDQKMTDLANELASLEESAFAKFEALQGKIGRENPLLIEKFKSDVKRKEEISPELKILKLVRDDIADAVYDLSGMETLTLEEIVSQKIKEKKLEIKKQNLTQDERALREKRASSEEQKRSLEAQMKAKRAEIDLKRSILSELAARIAKQKQELVVQLNSRLAFELGGIPGLDQEGIERVRTFAATYVSTHEGLPDLENELVKKATTNSWRERLGNFVGWPTAAYRARRIDVANYFAFVSSKNEIVKGLKTLEESPVGELNSEPLVEAIRKEAARVEQRVEQQDRLQIISYAQAYGHPLKVDSLLADYNAYAQVVIPLHSEENELNRLFREKIKIEAEVKAIDAQLRDVEFNQVMSGMPAFSARK